MTEKELREWHSDVSKEDNIEMFMRYFEADSIQSLCNELATELLYRMTKTEIKEIKEIYDEIQKEWFAE